MGPSRLLPEHPQSIATSVHYTVQCTSPELERMEQRSNEEQTEQRKSPDTTAAQGEADIFFKSVRFMGLYERRK